LSAELRISTQGKNPPSWATGDQSGNYFSYYENEHGEQWGVNLDGNTPRFPGPDINWEKHSLNAEQAVTENNRIVDQIVANVLMQSRDLPESITKAYLDVAALKKRPYGAELPLAKIMLGTGELLLASMFHSAIHLMNVKGSA